MAREEREASRAESARRFDLSMGMRRDEMAMRQGRMALDILGRRRSEAMDRMDQIRSDLASGAVDPRNPAVQQAWRAATEGLNHADAMLGAKIREVAGIDIQTGRVEDPTGWQAFQQDVEVQRVREQDPGHVVDMQGKASVLEQEITSLRSQMRSAPKRELGRIERELKFKINELAGVQSEVRRIAESRAARSQKMQQFEAMRAQAKHVNGLKSYADSLLEAETSLTTEQRVAARAAMHRDAELKGTTNDDIRATLKRMLPQAAETPLTPEQEEAQARRQGELSAVREDGKKDRLEQEGRGPKPEKPKQVTKVSPDAAAIGIRQAMERDHAESIEEVMANRSAEELIAASLSSLMPEDRREEAFKVGIARLLDDEDGEISRDDRIARFNSVFGALPPEARTREFGERLKGALGL